MADGSVVFVAEMDDKQAQTELTRLNKKIENLNDKIREQEALKMPLVEQARRLGAELDAAKAKLAEMQSGDGFYSANSISEQQAKIKTLQAEWDAVNRKIDGYDASIARSNVQIDINQEKLGGVEQQLASVGGTADSGVSPALDRMNAKIDTFSKRIGGLMRRVFVFSLITMALRAMRTWLGNVIKTNAEATAAIARLKGALLTLAQPLVNVIIPAFTMFVNILARLINLIASLTAKLFGTTRDESAKAAESLNAEASALGATGKAAKKASKSLASFDEINQLSGNADDSASAGGGVGGSGIAPDFKTMIASELESIVELFAGALLLGLGAILTFSGANIPVGLALMALGALAIYDAVSSNWDAIAEKLRGSLGAIVAVVSASLLAIGAILAFSSVNIPLGLGLMAVGAVGLAAVVAANWDTLKKLVADNLIYIGMIAGGAVLALGIILAASNVNLPLGIALIAMGATALIGAAATNWNALPTQIQHTISIIMGAAGAALLVLGIILVASNVNLPLGIALIAAGAASLVTVAALNWDAIKNKVAEVWTGIKEYWNSHISKYFTADWWHELGRNAINGLISAIEMGLNWIIEKLNYFIEWANEALEPLQFLGITVQIPTIPNVSIPRLAQGAVIPPNREFLAVLGDQKSGTNIETPLATMVQAFKQALAEGGYGGNSEAVLMLDRETLGKVVYRLNKAEDNRIGVSLTGV